MSGERELTEETDDYYCDCCPASGCYCGDCDGCQPMDEQDEPLNED